MRILVATPAHNGQVTVQYFSSFLQTIEFVSKVNAEHFPKGNGIQIGTYTLTHEALVSRGRNHCAQVAISQGWDKLFFIDADAGWTPQQFMAVATSPHEITAGTCPLKTYPISLNYLPFQDDEHYYKDNIRSVESLLAMRNGYKQSLLKVPFVGTAFMCITTATLKKLSEFVDPYQYPNPLTGQNETHWDFFQTKPIKKTYMSEDWGFCNLAREHGIDVYIQSDVIITHTGNHTFKGPEIRRATEEEMAGTNVGKATAVQAQGVENAISPNA